MVLVILSLFQQVNAVSFYERSEMTVAWPAQNTPKELFGYKVPWSLSIGRKISNPTAVKVTLTNYSNGEVNTYTLASCSDGGEMFVNNDSYGQAGCIIWIPAKKVDDNESYHVNVSADGVGYDYDVNFFNVVDSTPVPTKTPTTNPIPTSKPTPIPTQRPSEKPEGLRLYNGSSVKATMTGGYGEFYYNFTTGNNTEEVYLDLKGDNIADIDLVVSYMDNDVMICHDNYSSNEGTKRIKVSMIRANTSYSIRVCVNTMNGNGGTFSLKYNEVERVAPTQAPKPTTAPTKAPTQAPVSAQNSQVKSFVARLYNVALGRSYDDAGLNDWTNKLTSGTQTGAEVARGFICSEEFKNRNLSDSDYVDTLYRTMFNRESDAVGKANWMNALANGMSREYVYRGFAEGQEFKNLCDSYGIKQGKVNLTQNRDQNPGLTAFVARNYTKALGRTAEEAGINDWTGRILKGQATPADVTAGFIFSPEFANKYLSNEDFVWVLYQTYFDREPDAGGYANWVNQLYSGVSRDYVVNTGFSCSQEFRNLIASFGL